MTLKQYILGTIKVWIKEGAEIIRHCPVGGFQQDLWMNWIVGKRK